MNKMTKAEIIESIKKQSNHLEWIAERGNCRTTAQNANVLRKAADLLEAVPEWISVDDRLPERNTRVLVYAQEKEDGFEGKYVITIASYTDNLFGYDISGWVEPWQYFFASYKITHWMHLPESPREGTK